MARWQRGNSNRIIGAACLLRTSVFRIQCIRRYFPVNQYRARQCLAICHVILKLTQIEMYKIFKNSEFFENTKITNSYRILSPVN
ncbi:hypothetical protein ALC57_04170 [Trachymyrmex cornetzi]|uniref:Uncharacterized protein n=1 Tax=Trachymyrmex cornetzi TaxID=471704 RepID=A0A195EER6_9HYME|nr:hypothetical protein ALC57_04170 [Trachymyrmex cornetzi]